MARIWFLGQSTINIQYDLNTAITTTQNITVLAKSITSIAVATMPTKTVYLRNSVFDATGMVVTATYSDSSTAVLQNTNYKITNPNIQGNTSPRIIEYNGDSTISTTVNITFETKTVTNLTITIPPTKTYYKVGETFDRTGMVVTATYSDNSTAIVPNANYSVLYRDGDTYASSQCLISAGNTNIEVKYNYNETYYKAYQPIVVEKGDIRNIEVTTMPTKTIYMEGENFDSTGMVVTGAYDNPENYSIVLGTTAFYTVTNGTNLQEGQQNIIIEHNLDPLVRTQIPITVQATAITSIAVTTPPTKTAYIAGQDFDVTGMVITATYDDSSTEIIPTENCTVTNGTNLTTGQTSVTINYIGASTTQAITVQAKVVTSIAVTTPPTKTAYIAGQDFNNTGMIITATYNDNTTETTTAYTVTNGTNLTTGQTSVTIQLNSNDEITITQAITVETKVVTSIAVTTPPTKTAYIAGQDFDKTGMSVTATYDDDTTAIISNENYTVTNGTNLTIGQTIVTIQLNGSTSITTTQNITVVAKAITSIAVTTPPTKTAYVAEQNFDSTGMVVTATYNDSTTEATTEYTVTDGTSLTTGKTTVTIQLNSNEEITTTQNITVVAKAITSIAVTTPPTKTSYIVGENFDSTGMVVTATYNDSTTSAITTYTVTNGTNLTTGQTSVTIQLNGATSITTTQSITLTTITEELEITEYEIVEGETNYIVQISTDTDLTTFIGKLETGAAIEIYDGETQIEETDKIATGMELRLTRGEQEARYVLIVNGDTNGDGLADARDSLAILYHRASLNALTNAYFKAADLNGDNIINGQDSLRLLYSRAGIQGYEL